MHLFMEQDLNKEALARLRADLGDAGLEEYAPMSIAELVKVKSKKKASND